MESDFYNDKFYFARTPLEQADLVIWGLPWDCTTSYRAGTREGPYALRRAFEAVESFSPYCDQDLEDLKIHDAGNLELPFGDTDQTLALIRRHTQRFLQQNKKLISLGGEHLLTLPLIEQYYKHFGPNLHILHLDAHCDLREEYLGVKFSHASVMSLTREHIGIDNISHFFIRSGSRKEWLRLRQSPHTYVLNYPCTEDTIDKIPLDYLRNNKLYLTIDLDVFDPALIPGTGVPDAGGITFDDFISFLDRLNGFNLVGCDLMELAPQIDPTGASSITAAKILRETIFKMV